MRGTTSAVRWWEVERPVCQYCIFLNIEESKYTIMEHILQSWGEWGPQWCVVGVEGWCLMELPSAGEAEAVGMDGRPTLPLPSVRPAAPKPNKEHFSRLKNTIIGKELLILLAQELERKGPIFLSSSAVFRFSKIFSPSFKALASPWIVPCPFYLKTMTC